MVTARLLYLIYETEAKEINNNPPFTMIRLAITETAESI